jgi:putative ABC transport system permease protein
MLKYMIYSGSAALIGCVLGFLLGSKYFPVALWIAYGMMFGFAPLEYYFSLPLALISLAVALLCSIGTTYLACRGQLRNMPAEILRPRAPKAGKRVLLERVGFVWNNLKFLHKVTIRNIFRYKKRMIMMIVGIGGCTALVTAGFGIDDSIAGIGDHQYLGIQKYDVTVVFSEEVDEEKRGDFELEYEDAISSTALVQMTSVTLSSDEASKPANLVITDDPNLTEAVNFQLEDKKVPYPEEGEALLNNKMAEMLGIDVGDSFEVEYGDTEHVTFTLTGIYRNYVGNYLYINDKTYENIMHEDYEP